MIGCGCRYTRWGHQVDVLPALRVGQVQSCRTGGLQPQVPDRFLPRRVIGKVYSMVLCSFVASCVLWEPALKCHY